MSTSSRSRSRLVAGAALVPASVMAILASWSLSGPVGPSTPTSVDPSSAIMARPASSGASAGRVQLRFPDGLVTVALEDTSAARAFATILPLQLTLNDPWGQAKSGQLPAPIDTTGAEHVVDPRVGELYYDAPSRSIAIFYDDLGQSVPPPGLVRLGTVDDGMSWISAAGHDLPARIQATDTALTGAGS